MPGDYFPYFLSSFLFTQNVKCCLILLKSHKYLLPLHPKNTQKQHFSKPGFLERTSSGHVEYTRRYNPSIVDLQHRPFRRPNHVLYYAKISPVSPVAFDFFNSCPSYTVSVNLLSIINAFILPGTDLGIYLRAVNIFYSSICRMFRITRITLLVFSPGVFLRRDMRVHAYLHPLITRVGTSHRMVSDLIHYYLRSTRNIAFNTIERNCSQNESEKKNTTDFLNFKN